MNIRSLVLGLAVGFLAGWIAFSSTRTPVPPPIESEPPLSPPPPIPPPPAPDPVPVAELPPPPVLNLFKNGTPADVLWVVRNQGPDLTDEEVQALADRLDVVIEGGERYIFGAVLSGLRDLDHDIARRRLLEFIADERVPILDGYVYVEVFEGSDLPGIAAAARQRWVMNARAGRDRERASSGWADLIATHGGPYDHAWLRQNSENRVR